MSVIYLSSDDEDDCIVLDSNEGDFMGRTAKTHQVFIVENTHSCSFNAESDPSEALLPNFVNDFGEQNLSNDNEASLPRNNIETTHLSVDLGDVVRDQNEHSYLDKTGNMTRLEGKLNKLSNQTIDLLISAKESNCVSGQRVQSLNTSCLAPPISNRNLEKKSEGALKVLAEKLSQVLGNNNHSEVLIKENMSKLDKVILDVSKGFFKRDTHENKLLGLSPTNRKISKSKDTKKKKKTFLTKISEPSKRCSDNVVSTIQKHLSTIQSVQLVAETNSNVNQVSSTGTKCLEINTNKQTYHSKTGINQPKCPSKTGDNIKVNRKPSSSKRIINVVPEPSPAAEAKHSQSRQTQSPPDPALESINQTNKVTYEKEKLQLKQKVVLKSRSKSIDNIKPYKPHTPKNKSFSVEKGGPYDNKLKFTFDRSISVYSVSVVSPSEPQSLKENMRDTQSETPVADDFRSLSSPLSDILSLKSSFVKHYSIVFDDKTDALCVEMGYLLFQTIEESKNLQNYMETRNNYLSDSARTTQQSHMLLIGSNELKDAVQTCQDVLHQSKRKFVDSFSKIYDQIDQSHIVGTQLKIVLLTAWFMKMFLSITTKSPDLMEFLHDIKVKALDFLSEKIARWPLIYKTFFKDDYRFQCECLLVLEFIKDCLQDQNELDTQTSINLGQNENAQNPQTIGDQDESNQDISLPKELQKLVKTRAIDVIVITNKSELTKATNCETDSIQPETNKQELSEVLQRKQGLSKNYQTSRKSSGEYLQTHNHTSNQNNASPKTHLQNYSKNDNTHKFPTDKCERVVENPKSLKPPKTNCAQHIPEKLQIHEKLRTHMNDNPKRPSSVLVPVEDKASKKKAFGAVKHCTMEELPVVNIVDRELSSVKLNTYPQEMSIPSLKNPSNRKQIQHPYEKEHVFSTGIVNQHLQMNPPLYISNGQDPYYKNNQVYLEAQSHEPPALNRSKECNGFQSSQSENQYYPNTHVQQNCQSYQPNIYSHQTSPSHPQYYQYSNQGYYHDVPAVPTAPNSFPANYLPTISCVNSSNKQPFIASDGGKIDLSPCRTVSRTPSYSVCGVMSNTAGVTINNYNITSYPPHISPKYNSTVSIDKRAVVAPAVHTPPAIRK